MNQHTTFVTIGVVVIVAVVGGVGYALQQSSNKSTSPTPTPGTSTQTPVSSVDGKASVTIQNFNFSAPNVVIHVGDTVQWTNNDSTAHTVTSTDGGPLSSGNLVTGSVYSYTFTKAGSYAYKCTYHPSMVGTVVVQ